MYTVGHEYPGGGHPIYSSQANLLPCNITEGQNPRKCMSEVLPVLIHRDTMIDLKIEKEHVVKGHNNKKAENRKPRKKEADGQKLRK